MPGRQAKTEPYEKDRLPGAVSTHAAPPLLSPAEIWAVAGFLFCVLLCIVALEAWASRPAQRPARDAAIGTHPFLSAPRAPPDAIGMVDPFASAQ